MIRIGLSMIVKNEAAVITRCLDSVAPFAQFVCVEDTGSTDGTQEIIRAWLTNHGIAGMVYDRPWVNFADNRSSSLATLRAHSDVDYALVMDADDEFVIENPVGFDMAVQQMKADRLRIRLTGVGVEYYRVQVASNRKAFFYRGVLHEFMEGPKPFTEAVLPYCSIRSNRQGSRSADPQKYHKDADLLRTALATETDAFMVSRYTFYLAQSCRDAGLHEEALQHYLARAEQGFWIEERYVALLNAARLYDRQGLGTAEQIVETYRRAIACIAHRAEAYHGLARYLRLQKRYAEAVEAGFPAIRLRTVPEGLFVEPWAYTFGARDEVAVSAYWADNKALSLQLCVELLESGKVPAAQLERVRANARYAREWVNQLNERHDKLN